MSEKLKKMAEKTKQEDRVYTISEHDALYILGVARMGANALKDVSGAHAKIQVISDKLFAQEQEQTKK